MSLIKVNRARKLAGIGDCPASYSRMLDAIPDSVVAALPARLVALLVDANWRLAAASKTIAERAACDAGVVWDEAQGRMRELSA